MLCLSVCDPEGAQEHVVIAARSPPHLWIIGLITPLIALLQVWHCEFSFDRKSVPVCMLLDYTLRPPCLCFDNVIYDEGKITGCTNYGYCGIQPSVGMAPSCLVTICLINLIIWFPPSSAVSKWQPLSGKFHRNEHCPMQGNRLGWK